MSIGNNGRSNLFFNNVKSSQEQLLIESLIIEAISIYGLDCYYIPRTLNNYDGIYGADDQSSYEKVYNLCMYLENTNGFGGDQDFMSKFGLEIRDQVIFSVAQRIFTQEVSKYTNQSRPNEGDLIYFPLNKKCFQIKFTDKFEMFYQMGALQTYKMTCELFEYSNEKFNTGIPEIDSIQDKMSTNEFDRAIKDEDNIPIVDENNDLIVIEKTDININDTNQINTEADTFIDFSVNNPFSERL